MIEALWLEKQIGKGVEQRGIHAAFSYGLGILRSDIGHFRE